jgi:hypothetical protein
MSYDAMAALRAAGHPVDVLSENQRGILAGLSEAEVATLNSIKTRLDAAGNTEVEGQDVYIVI